jgi:hypothetical protein
MTNRCRGCAGLLFGAMSFLAVGGRADAASIYSAALLADGPLAYYRLDETTGTLADNLGSAGATVDGTYVNLGTGSGANNIGQVGPRPGDLSGSDAINGLESTNNAARFAPLTAPAFPRVEVPWNPIGPNPLALDGTTGLTLEAWIYRDPQAVLTSNDNEGIISRFQQFQGGISGQPGARGYNLYYDDDINAFGFSTSHNGSAQSVANGGVVEATGYDVPLGEWVHVVATYESNGAVANLAIYANGEVVASTTSTTVLSLYSGQADFWIGQQFNNNRQWTFEGSIDEVAVYNYALSASQILGHYEAAVVPEPGAIVLAGCALLIAVRGAGRRRG